MYFIHKQGRKYWRGKFPLAISFWVVFCGGGCAFHLVSYFLLQQAEHTSLSYTIALIAYQMSGSLLFVWQGIGLLRSAERYYEQFGKPVILHSVQAWVLISFVLMLSHFVGLIQILSFNQSFEASKLTAKPKQYSLQLADNERLLILRGLLDFGITNAVGSLLTTHTNIRRVMLESEGGQVYEGRGLAMLFQQFGLDTYSDGYCLSSCTIAFMGGDRRYLGKQGLLGFHQYSFESDLLQNFEDFYDLDEEQDKDLALYRSKGIEEDFIQQIFKKSGDEIWYPSQETLLRSGVVHHIMDSQ